MELLFPQKVKIKILAACLRNKKKNQRERPVIFVVSTKKIFFALDTQGEAELPLLTVYCAPRVLYLGRTLLLDVQWD